MTAVAVSVAALVAACGGGGGGGDSATATPAQSGVVLSGVAATGLALANSAVDVKCAAGTGSATTNDAGSYTVTVTDGALPCIVKVTGTANGVAVTLHSVAEAGTTNGSTTTATANVTPLTELILARAGGTLPSDLFTNFGTGTAVTAAALTQATTDILAAIGTAAGVDLSGVDPFKAALVAATPGNLSGGNDYDKLLDQIGTTLSVASLPQVVSQVASTVGSTAPVTLTEVVANVSKGSLAGCPQALSGKYRLLDYVGATDVVDIDFGAMSLTAGEEVVTLTANSTQPCEFLANGSVPTTVVIGPSGAGAIRDGERIGYIFPVQAHSFASVQGKWEFLESGINETQQGEHWIGEMDIAADGKVTVCDYDVAQNNFSSCVVDTDEAASLQQSGDALVLNYGQTTGLVYGFRGPNGALTLFGTYNPTGNTASGFLKTNFVLTRPQRNDTQAVGSISKFWDIAQLYQPTSTSGGQPVLFAGAPARNSITVTASTETSVTRQLTSSGTDNGRIDTVQLNNPIPGLRSRAEGPSNLSGQTISAVYIRNLPGTNMSVAIDAMATRHFMSLTVTRP
ncbi:hypothetical protein ASG30_11105 [Ramlibacter sp. Leaf400]|nr:hypothetical protein ASG30_11105 [Ramlibacter sp. Leaf400]